MGKSRCKGEEDWLCAKKYAGFERVRHGNGFLGKI